jgi:hypothetical protein
MFFWILGVLSLLVVAEVDDVAEDDQFPLFGNYNLCRFFNESFSKESGRNLYTAFNCPVNNTVICAQLPAGKFIYETRRILGFFRVLLSTNFVVGECDANYRVTRLNISFPKLRTTLGPSIASFTRLQSFEAANETFAGRLPSIIGRLSYLQKLDVTGNCMSLIT